MLVDFARDHSQMPIIQGLKFFNRLIIDMAFFGRARLDLLSRRFVLAPREGQAQGPDQCAPAQAHAEAEAA